MANDASLVAVGSPKVGGAVFAAPKGTTAPTDGTTALADTFVSLGYVTEDGVVIAEDTDSDDLVAWGGDVVRTTQTSFSETTELTLMQYSLDAMQLVYGSDYVSGDDASFTIKSTANRPAECVLVIETVLASDITDRIVIPRAQLSERDDANFNGSDPAGRALTFKNLADTSGVCHYEYVVNAAATTTVTG